MSPRGSWLAASLVCALGGCIVSRENPDHCVALGGDDYCKRAVPERRYCARDAAGCDAYDPRTNRTGCVAEVPPDSCRPCGTGVCEGSATAPSSSSVGESESEDDNESEPPTDLPGGSDTPLACRSDDECSDPTRPFCNGEQCLGCDAFADGSAACADRFDDRPYCNAGTCVECLGELGCGGDAPICDLERAVCRGCQEHGECESGGCLRVHGACVPPDRVFHVVSDAAPDGDGSLEAPFARVTDALDRIGNDPAVLVLAAGDHRTRLRLRDARELVIRSEGGRPTLLDQTGGSGSIITVEGSATLYLDGLRFETTLQDPALAISRATAELDRTVFFGSPNTAIYVSTSSAVSLRNSIVGGNGEAGSGGSAIFVESSDLDIVYSTLAGNLGAAGAASIACGESGAEVTVRNSIVVSEGGPSIACDIVAETSVVDHEPSAGEGSVVVAAGDPAWFLEPEQGDFRLSPAGEDQFRDIAVWQEGDPRVDIDGQDRVCVDGEREHPGADRP